MCKVHRPHLNVALSSCDTSFNNLLIFEKVTPYPKPFQERHLNRMHSHFTSIVSEAVLYLEPWWGGEKRAKPMMFKEIRTSTWETFSFVFRVTLGYYLPPYVGRSPADGPTLLPDQEHKWHWLLSFVHEKPGCDLSMSGDVLLISTFHGVFWGAEHCPMHLCHMWHCTA